MMSRPPHRYRHGGPRTRCPCCGWSHVDHTAPLQAEDVARDRANLATVSSPACSAVRGRGRPEDEQRLVVPQRPRLHAILAGIGQDGIAVRDLEGAEGRTPGRGGASAADIDTAWAPLARMERPASISSWPPADGASSNTRLSCPRHCRARCCRRPPRRAMDGYTKAAAVRRHPRDIGGQLFSQNRLLLTVIGVRLPPAENRLIAVDGVHSVNAFAADDRIRRDHLVGTGVDLRDAARVADAAQHQVGARVDQATASPAPGAPAHDPAPAGRIRRAQSSRRSAVHAAHLPGRQG